MNKITKIYMTIPRKINKWTQRLIQSDPHQGFNMKGKDRQIQSNNQKISRWQTELAALFQKKSGISVTQTTYVTPKGGQDAPRMTSSLTNLRVGRSLIVPLHRDSDNVRIVLQYFLNKYYLQQIITITYNTKHTWNSTRLGRGKEHSTTGDFRGL